MTNTRQSFHVALLSPPDGRGNTRHTEYNALGLQSAAIDALGNRTSYAYDQFGNLSSVTDPLGHAIVYEYDLRGRKTYEGGATYPVRYTYDAFGNKTTMMTYRKESLGPYSGDVTTWLYDEASGAMTNKVYADGKGPSYTYTPDGKPSRRIWARGITTDYAYDGWGNLTNTVYSDDTPTVSLFYDALGRQTEARDAAGVTTFLYDSFGSLTNETVIGVAGTNTIERIYDAFGRNAGYALNGARQSTLAYDSATGRLVAMLVDGIGTPFVWNYLAGSDLKSSLAYPKGLTASWIYDANNQLLQVCNATPTNIISQYDYVYDVAGRRISCTKSGSAFTQDDTIAYGYNIRSELTNAVAAVDLDYRYYYAFDEIGNRKTSSERGTNVLYSANSLNQYTAVADFIPQFDDDGNQTFVKTTTGVWQVQYNGENRPVRWVNGDSVISMSYDRMGRRVEKNSQRFIYEGYLQIANFEQSVANSQFTTCNSQLFIWDSTEPIATRPLVWFSGMSAAYYTHDGNKNVSEVVSENGEPITHYDFAPFGAVTAHRSASVVVNPWRFSCEYVDDDTAMVYYNYRHYGPVMGRWMQRDPIFDKGGVNVYSMVENTPYIRSDLLGLGWAGILSPSGGTLSYSEPISQMVILNGFAGRLEMSTKGSATYTATNKSRAECVDGPDTPVKTSGEWNVKSWPPALSRKVVVSHGQAWQETTRLTMEEYLVYTGIDVSVGIDGTGYKWSEKFCTCFKLTYGISAHGTAYVNNFGVATIAIGVTVVGKAVVATMPALMPILTSIIEALSPKPLPIPAPLF